ncbi:unnamed protein product [Ranitomeya imitator]|uniref:Uncharacterized protein n=1 Tax=Ranitomeya imitator TaxID=111125 RepID=A0ABN9MP61_9NEOB|nr:unnamed protein product [Ranitomeya imitator]
MAYIKSAKFSLESYQQLNREIFAIEEINNNHEASPESYIGFPSYDSCIAVQNSLAVDVPNVPYRTE